MIENEKVDSFYVGNQGGFDSMTLDILIELSNLYNVRYNVVLAYIAGKKLILSNIKTLIQFSLMELRILLRDLLFRTETSG